MAEMITPDMLWMWEKEYREKIKFRPERHTRLTYLTKRINDHIRKREAVMDRYKKEKENGKV